jgi:hypothetical protein
MSTYNISISNMQATDYTGSQQQTITSIFAKEGEKLVTPL